MGKKVTVVGAGFYGATTAQRLAEYDIFETVVLTDIVEGKPEGLALDLNQSRPVEGFETKVVGATTGPNGEGYEAIEGSDVVVITAGLPRKPGMSRMDLLGVNAKIVRGVAENIAKYAPNAGLDRGHHGAGTVAVHRRRKAAVRGAAGGEDRGAGGPDPQRWRRDRRT